MKSYIFSIAILLGSLHAQTSEIHDPGKEKSPEVDVDFGDLKSGSIGYRVESSDFKADPDRLLVVTLRANGQIIDIRGRYSNEQTVEEWSIYYKDGSPVLAQLKKWKKVSVDGEELGDALVNVETYLAKDGQFEISNKNAVKRVLEMKTFARDKQAEQR